MLTPVTAHHRGAGNTHLISKDLGQTLWITLISSLVLIGYLFTSESILTFMNVAPEVVPVAVGYLHALAFGLPGIALFYTLNSFMEGMGNTRVPMVISLLGLLVNIRLTMCLFMASLVFQPWALSAVVGRPAWCTG